MVNRLVITQKALAAIRVAKVLAQAQKHCVKTASKGGVVMYQVGDWLIIALSGHVVKYEYPQRYRRWQIRTLPALIHCELQSLIAKKWLNAMNDKNPIEVYIATDYDRQGSLIGYNFYDKCFNGIPAGRVKFTALTHGEILNAFHHPIDIDMRVVRVAAFRHELDLRIGATFTRAISLILGLRGQRYMSIGRVQTPLLCKIFEHEAKIALHKSTTYFQVIATWNGMKFKSKKLAKRPTIANNIVTTAKVVRNRRIVTSKRVTPLSTNSLLKLGHSIGIGLSKTMALAQSLYLGAHITYPRTNNQTYSDLKQIRRLAMAGKHCDASTYASPVAGTRDPDHPPITPLDGVNPMNLPNGTSALYSAICKHFTKVITAATVYEAHTEKLEFAKTRLPHLQRTYHRLITPGCMPITQGQPSVGDCLEVCLKIIECNTKPPKPWNAANLVDVMVKCHIGTKSTRHSIVNRLLNRGYLNNAHRITRHGIIAANVFMKCITPLTLPDFTCKLQEAFTKHVEKGTPIGDEWLQSLSKLLSNVMQNAAALRNYAYSKQSANFKRCERDSNPRKN